MLTHVDNLGDLNLDMTSQEQSLETIASLTSRISDTVDHIDSNNADTGSFVQHILEDTGRLNMNTSQISSAVGTTADASSNNTVIGLLKSIANKL